MLTAYGFIALFLIVVTLLAGTMIFIPVILRWMKIVPHHPNSVKNASFECGMPTIGKTWVRFNFRYYFFALVFIALDVFVILLFPWAVNLRQLGFMALAGMTFFILVLGIAYIYAWKKKALEWK
jgi:NADH-quinone oxidoreductase subunit A